MAGYFRQIIGYRNLCNLVATMTKCSPCHTTGTCKFKEIRAISMNQTRNMFNTTVPERTPYEVLGNFLQTTDCIPKVGKSSCDVIYSLNYYYYLTRCSQGCSINSLVIH